MSKLLYHFFFLNCMIWQQQELRNIIIKDKTSDFSSYKKKTNKIIRNET